MKLLLLLLIFVPTVTLASFDSATNLKRAGFPQLQGIYWKTYKGIPTRFSYKGKKPLKSWSYEPTNDELISAMTGTLILARDATVWTALNDRAHTTGATLNDALTTLYLLNP